ncbi:MAG: glycosyltransferase family 4 protein [Candidatus Heimdallarchaeaceae archaeon]
MRILMLASCYPTEKEPYLCLFLKELTEELEKIIPEHYVLSLHGYGKIKLLKRLFEIRSFIKKNHVDLIHAQFGYSAGFYGSLINAKKPLIITVHRFELFRKKIRPLLKYAFKKADRIIAVSNYVRKEIVRILPTVEEKVLVLPNGVITEKFSKKEIRDVKPTDVIKIGTLAHHSKRKGIDLLIRSFYDLEKKFTNLELHIAGKGPETESLKQLAKELGIKKITFHGSILEKQKVDFYHSLDIFVLSSDSEGHPVALLESMCSGACPIVSNIPAIEDTIIDKKNGRIFNLETYKNLTKVLEEVLQDSEALNQYKHEARKTVIQNFNLHERAEKLKTIYEGILASSD